MRTLIGFLTGLGLVGATLAGPGAVSAQVDGSDAGTFRITVDGREVGTDTFTIRQSGEGQNAVTTATGRVRLQLAETTVDIIPELRVTGIPGQVARYNVSPPPGVTGTRIFGTVSGGIFTTEMRTPTGEGMRQFRVSEGALVLDEWVAHQYHLLALWAEPGSVPVVIPSHTRQVMGTLERRGDGTTRIAGQDVRATQLVLTLDDGRDVRRIWVDDRSRVLRVEIPASGYVAVRTALPR